MREEHKNTYSVINILLQLGIYTKRYMVVYIKIRIMYKDPGE